MIDWVAKTSSEKSAQLRFSSWELSKLGSPISGRLVNQACALIVPINSDGNKITSDARWVPINQIKSGL